MSLEADLLDAAELGPLLDEVVLPQAAKVMVANNAAPQLSTSSLFFPPQAFTVVHVLDAKIVSGNNQCLRVWLSKVFWQRGVLMLMLALTSDG